MWLLSFILVIGGYDLEALSASALAHVRVLAAGYPSPKPPAPSHTPGDVVAALAAHIDSLGVL